jgi:hypothetical protein
VEVRRALRDLLRESSFLNTEGAQQVADTETGRRGLQLGCCSADE